MSRRNTVVFHQKEPPPVEGQRRSRAILTISSMLLPLTRSRKIVLTISAVTGFGTGIFRFLS
ncbi:MAG: hypothetical protein HY403_06175 [Elusimicrobia bacterium]|nr:hypothetical protein [Elusimicrobiota bacterium]